MNHTKRYLSQLLTLSGLILLAAGVASAAPHIGGGSPAMMPFGAQHPVGPIDLAAMGYPGGQRAPLFSSHGGGGPQLYGPFAVDTATDPFVDPERFNQVTGRSFVDDNGDGISDSFQDTALYRDAWGLEWVDDNQDGISDLFQTRLMYQTMGMDNFVDVDADGLCDNYELFPREPSGPGNFRGSMGPQFYQPFEVGTSDDLFVSPERFAQRTGLPFVDENGDGVCDYFQDGPRFRQLGLGAFVDVNEDGIADSFQTREMYWALGLHNYVDVDGDGLCDNFEQDPLAGTAENR